MTIQDPQTNRGAAMSEPTDRGLYVKLVEVVNAVGRVEKRGRNEHFKYDYVKEDDLVEAVRGELAARQVVLLPATVGITKDGSLTTVQMRFCFVDGDTGQTHEAEWYGTGDDKSDKGLYKAYTGAVKYFLMKTFLIPTGDDPERDKPSDQKQGQRQDGQPKTDTWEATMRIRIQAFDLVDKTKMKLTSMGVEKLEELTAQQAKELEKWIDETAKATVEGG